MDLTLAPEYGRFRDEIRAFLADHLTDDIREAGRLATSVFPDPPRTMAWQKILHARGWAAPHWPVEHGGTGWDILQRSIFAEECLKAGAPPLIPMSLHMCGPCIIGFGTPDQKAHYLPRILSGEDFWCQGYSEPGAGSDLASLQMSAESDGDHYVLNGAKIWTSFAQYANRMFCLVRTRRGGKPQEGITFLLLDMNTPGITVEPIIGLDLRHEQNTVFLNNVRVPKSNRVGDEDKGWTVAKYLLEFERGGQEYGTGLRVQLQAVRELAAAESIPGVGSLLEDRVFARKLAETEIEITALEFTEHRIKAALGAGKNPGPIASLTKIRGTELAQRVTELAIEVVGLYGLPLQPEAIMPGHQVPFVGPEQALTVMPRYLCTRATTIYGGSNEIQRGIIAKMVLGL